jgi:hypothetical protein
MASSVFERTRALHADVEEAHERLLDTANRPAHSVRSTANNSNGRQPHGVRENACESDED